MSNRGTALVVAAAIYAGTKDQRIVDIEDLEDRLYRAVNGTPFGLTEAKADVYAQLAESLAADTTFKEACDKIEYAMNNTACYLPGGIHYAQG